MATFLAIVNYLCYIYSMDSFKQTELNKNDVLYALRRAMASGSGKYNIADLPVYTAPTALHSYLASSVLTGAPHYLYLDKNNSVVNSHELGHAIDHSHLLNRALAVGGYHISPFSEPINTLASESAANMYSWNALKNVYKDDPELLEEFGNLRHDLLTPAYSTYMYSGANEGLVRNFGSDIGNTMGYTLGLHDALYNQGANLRDANNSLSTRYRIHKLNKKIINHAKKHDYYY